MPRGSACVPTIASPAARSFAKARGSSARRCTRASVCNTESCRCAATSARSSARMRSRRSATNACTRRVTAGTDDERDADHDRDDRDERAAQRAPRVDGDHERDETRHHARDAGRDARRARPCGCRTTPRPRRPRRVAGVRRKASRGARRSRRFGAVRIASSARPTSVAASGHTMTSPGHSPTARTRSRPPSTTAPKAAVAIASPRGRRTAVPTGRRHQRPSRAVEDHAEPARDRSTTKPHRTTFGSRPNASAEPGRDPRDHAPFDGPREVAATEHTRGEPPADDRAEPDSGHSASGSGQGDSRYRRACGRAHAGCHGT